MSGYSIQIYVRHLLDKEGKVHDEGKKVLAAYKQLLAKGYEARIVDDGIDKLDRKTIETALAAEKIPANAVMSLQSAERLGSSHVLDPFTQYRGQTTSITTGPSVISTLEDFVKLADAYDTYKPTVAADQPKRCLIVPASHVQGNTPEAVAIRSALQKLKDQDPPFFIVLTDAKADDLKSVDASAPSQYYDIAVATASYTTRDFITGSQEKPDLAISFGGDKPADVQRKLEGLAAAPAPVIVLSLNLVLEVDTKATAENATGEKVYKLKDAAGTQALLAKLKALSEEKPPYTIIWQRPEGASYTDEQAISAALTEQGLPHPRFLTPMPNELSSDYTARLHKNLSQEMQVSRIDAISVNAKGRRVRGKDAEGKAIGVVTTSAELALEKIEVVVQQTKEAEAKKTDELAARQATRSAPTTTPSESKTNTQGLPQTPPPNTVAPPLPVPRNTPLVPDLSAITEGSEESQLDISRASAAGASSATSTSASITATEPLKKTSQPWWQDYKRELLFALLFLLLGLAAGLLVGLAPPALAVIAAGGALATLLGISALSPALFGLTIGAGVFLALSVVGLIVYGLGSGAKAFSGPLPVIPSSKLDPAAAVLPKDTELTRVVAPEASSQRGSRPSTTPTHPPA